MLFAAAFSGRSIADVVRWVDHQTADEVERLLEVAACQEAADAWTARDVRGPKQRSSIYTTLETVLDAYQDPRVLRDAGRSAISPTRLLDGGRSALASRRKVDEVVLLELRALRGPRWRCGWTARRGGTNSTRGNLR